MKIVVIILLVLLLAFIGIEIFALKNQYNIKMYQYTVSETFNNFEIRNYEARLFTSVNRNTNNFKMPLVKDSEF